MRRFPGEVARGGNNYREVILNEEQDEWLRRWFPVTENYRLAKAMGVSIECMRKNARRLGLVKSEQGMVAILKRQGQRMARTFRKKGFYDAKKGVRPSEATLEGNRRRWEEVKAGKRKSPLQVLKEKSPKRYAERLRKISESRKETFRKEKMRMLYGLDRQTNLTVVVMKPYTKSQIHHRHNALKRGYLLDEDCREGSDGRYTIYYDENTRRSEIFENNCIKDGFTIKKDE